MSLSELLKVLALKREVAERTKAKYKELYGAWYAEIGRELDEAQKAGGEAVAELEAAVRVAALAEYRQTQNKHPQPGVEIKMNTVVGYDPAKALDWAKEHRIALVPESLNAKEYKELVKGGHAPGTVQEEPVAAIARDLWKAMEGEA